jgi:hypothetical protein
MVPEVPGVVEVLGVQVALEVPEVGGPVVEEVSVVGLETYSLMTHH